MINNFVFDSKKMTFKQIREFKSHFFTEDKLNSKLVFNSKFKIYSKIITQSLLLNINAENHEL